MSERPDPEEMARRRRLAEEAIASDPTLGGLFAEPGLARPDVDPADWPDPTWTALLADPAAVTVTDVPGDTVTGAEVLAAVAGATAERAYVEQTGGGTATVYVGDPDADGRYRVVLGPGAYNWPDPATSEFWLGDLYVGPDDDGESDPRGPFSSLADVTAAVAAVLADPDPRPAMRAAERARLAAGPADRDPDRHPFTGGAYGMADACTSCLHSAERHAEVTA